VLERERPVGPGLRRAEAPRRVADGTAQLGADLRVGHRGAALVDDPPGEARSLAQADDEGQVLPGLRSETGEHERRVLVVANDQDVTELV